MIYKILDDIISFLKKFRILKCLKVIGVDIGGFIYISKIIFMVFYEIK